MGHMEASSGNIFQNFLKQGMGARPIFVGYENHLFEFLTDNARIADEISARVRVIYPEPTILAVPPLTPPTSSFGRQRLLIPVPFGSEASSDYLRIGPSTRCRATGSCAAWDNR